MKKPIYINLDDKSSYASLKGKWTQEEAFEGSVQIDFVYGMHCTKIADENHYLKNGLRILNLDQRIDFVLSEFNKHGLLPQENETLRTEISQGYNSWDLSCRENMIWFCLNRNLIFKDTGCERFFKYFGGEVVYRLFERNENVKIKEMLMKIGKPAVIHCWLPFDTIKPYQKCKIIDFINRTDKSNSECACIKTIEQKQIIKIEWL